MPATDSSPSKLYLLVPRGARLDSVHARLDRVLAHDVRQLAVVVEFDGRTGSLVYAGGEQAFWRGIRQRDSVLLATPVPRLKEAAQTGASIRRADIAEILKGDILALSARQIGISRAARVEKLVDQYSRGASAASIQQWVRQFDQVGARHVGELLADSIQVMTTRQVCGALFLRSELEELWSQIEEHSVAVCTLPRLSSSASTIASHASDWLPPLGKINRTFAQQLADDRGPKRIIAIDDGIWSGYDAICTIEDILGLPPTNPNRTPKSDGSIPRERFDEYEIEIRVGLRCDLGESAVNDFLRANSLDNVQVSKNHGQRLAVLGDPSESSLPEVNYSQVIACTLADGLVAPLFHASAGFQQLSAADLELLDTLCSEITRVNSPGKSSAWIDANRYGTNNIGSLMTFSHSCPKAALPCFRAGGELVVRTPTGKRKTLVWKPLFSSRLRTARAV